MKTRGGVMKTRGCFVIGIGVFGLLAASVLTATPAVAGRLSRLASNFTAFDGTQININKDAPQGGVKIYDRTVQAPEGDKVLYVTLQGTAHNHSCPSDFGTGIAVNCQVDGVSCNSGFGIDEDADALPSGWIDVTGTTVAFDDIGWTAFSYTWCTHVNETRRDQHVVKLFAADDDDRTECSNIIQTVSVHVDSGRFSHDNVDLGNDCKGYPNPNSVNDFD
jgi:hypothetical protein